MNGLNLRYAAFLLASGGLLYEGIYHKGFDVYWLGTLGYLACGILLLTLGSGVRLAWAMRVAAWVLASTGYVVMCVFAIPITFGWLRGTVIDGREWWYPSSSVASNLAEYWIMLGAIIEQVLVLVVAIAAVRWVNSYLLSRERSGRPGSSIRPAA